MSSQQTETVEPIEHMLTTVDNPFNPFTEFDDWLEYDAQMGYHTPGMLDRIAKDSNDISEPDQALALEWAMDEIVRLNVSGMWRKVSKENAEELKAKL